MKPLTVDTCLLLIPGEPREYVLHTVTMNVVDSFINLNFNNIQHEQTTDKVLLYAKQLLNLGCFYLELSDAIREGDGDCVLCCWRYASNVDEFRTENYAIDSLKCLVVQHDFIFTQHS